MRLSRQVLPTSEQNLVVFRNHLKMIPLIVVYSFDLCAFIGIILLSLSQTLNFPDLNNIYLYSIGLLTILILSWCLWQIIARQSLQFDPALSINQRGIQIHKLPLVAIDDRFIAWEEIKEISVYHYLFSTYLFIRLQNPQKFLTRFHTWKKLKYLFKCT